MALIVSTIKGELITSTLFDLVSDHFFFHFRDIIDVSQPLKPNEVIVFKVNPIF